MNARFDRRAQGRGGIGLARYEKTDRGQVVLRCVQIDARKLAREQLAGRLAKDAGSVARAAIGGARPAMHHGGGRLQGQYHDVVRGLTAEIREKPDTACVVFFERVRLCCESDGNAGVVRDGPTSLSKEVRGLRL